MASSVNPELVKKFKNARKALTEDSNVPQPETEVREDEEQLVKLQEIIDILVAAGYFRARIKGLSSFDKVVGGLVWCIESCNVDLDVDLLFRENLSIGQKIALTEKIVAVLPKLKCPRSIEPHQIQGLDFINIFPVIQWLVKRSLECRQEVASFVRACAVDQFNKKFGVIDKNHVKHLTLLQNLNIVSEIYRPHRYYRRKNSGPADIKSQLQITLLEYGHNDGSIQDSVTIDKQAIEQHKVDLDEENRENLNKHYTSLQNELKDAGVQSREQLVVDSLEEKKQVLTDKCNEFLKHQESLNRDINSNKAFLQQLRSKQHDAETALKELNHEDEDISKIKEIEDLIILNDHLKMQESQFKEHCKKELENINKLLEYVKTAKKNTQVQTNADFNEEIKEKLERTRTLRIKLAKVNREVALSHRQLDEIPKRAELAQYQKRFVELYNQVAVKHKETKQYFTLYNTLEDTSFWMKKELSLLNSISENYPEAMISSKSKDEFLEQFQNIVENVHSSKLKAQQELDKKKQTRDHFSSILQSLVEQQRKYVAAIKQLGVECRKQEMFIKTQGNC